MAQDKYFSRFILPTSDPVLPTGTDRRPGRILPYRRLCQQLLQCIPYIATIAAMAFYNAWAKLKAKRRNL
jgi:hypothetical protein